MKTKTHWEEMKILINKMEKVMNKTSVSNKEAKLLIEQADYLSDYFNGFKKYTMKTLNKAVKRKVVK